MSNEEKKKRAEYKKFRQKWITIQGVIIVVLAIIALVSSIMYYRNNRIAYINYSESSDVDYKVYLKENDFYDEEYLEENQIYVSSLIDNIVANFKYDLNVNVNSTEFKYDYKLDALLEISDKNTNMHMYQDITEIKSVNGKILSGTDKIVVNEEVKIDFQNFNKKAQAFLNTYDFVNEYIDKSAPGGKEHIGYIIDRVGFEEYKKWALKGVELDPETIKKDCVYWNGIHFDR